MIDSVIQTVIGAGTTASIVGVNLGYRWAPWVGLGTSPAWIIAAAKGGQWGMFAASLVCAASWAIGCARTLQRKGERNGKR